MNKHLKNNSMVIASIALLWSMPAAHGLVKLKADMIKSLTGQHKNGSKSVDEQADNQHTEMSSALINELNYVKLSAQALHGSLVVLGVAALAHNLAVKHVKNRACVQPSTYRQQVARVTRYFLYWSACAVAVSGTALVVSQLAR